MKSNITIRNCALNETKVGVYHVCCLRRNKKDELGVNKHIQLRLWLWD